MVWARATKEIKLLQMIMEVQKIGKMVIYILGKAPKAKIIKKAPKLILQITFHRIKTPKILTNKIPRLLIIIMQ